MEGKSREISLDELREILASHRQWLESGGSSGQRADLHEADLHWVDLHGENLRGANLSGANLSGAILSEVTLSRSNLGGVIMITANLHGAYLRGAYLRGANLSGANLRGAFLSEADLRGAFLSNTDLRGVFLSKADLGAADLEATDLRGASLRGANFLGARVAGARVSKRANLADAIIDNFEGFVFDEEDEERVKEEREKRDAKAEEVFEDQESSRFIVSLPCSFPPAKLGHVIILVSYLYEGVRLALTSPFHDIKNLLTQATRPELFGAYEDKHALKIESMERGSWVVGLVGKEGIAGFIKEMRLLRENDLLKRIEVMDRAAKLLEDRRKAALDSLLPVKKDALEEYNALVAAHQSPALCDEEREKLKSSLARAKARLDNLNERLDVAMQVFDQAINELFLVLTRLGGEVSLDGESLLPPVKQIAAV